MTTINSENNTNISYNIEDEKHEDIKIEDTKKEDNKKEDNKKEDTKNEDEKQEDIKNEDTKKEDTKKEDNKNEDNKNEDNKKEDKPKRTLIQIIIKLHKFLCLQATSIIILTLIVTSIYKCYDVLIYFSFGTFISILFIASYSLLLKFDVIASCEFNEKYNNYLFCLWKKYVPLCETSFFTFMASFAILWHIFFGFLALYYVKDFIRNSIATKYSYIIAYILIILFYAMNYSNSFKLYNKSLKMTLTEFRLAMFINLLISTGLIYYFETLKLSI